MRGTFTGFGLAFMAVMVIALLFFGGLAFRYYTADVRGRVDANEQIKSGSSRIVNYEHFFNLCASIQGNEAQIRALEKELSFGNNGERPRIQANITGVTAARARAIAQYNADAAKSYTQGQFRSSALPYQLSESAKETTCA